MMQLRSVALPLLVAALGVFAAYTANAQTTVFINEIHYDNSGTDVGEAIEIAGPAGTDLTGWSIVLYNGNGGASYDSDVLAGALVDAGSGFGFQTISYPSNGLQNGSPDGIALVDDMGSVVQFLSYEGSFVATDGPAMGTTSNDIGVSETSGTPAGFSLQLAGNGTEYEDFSWAGASASTFDTANNGQMFGGSSGPTTPVFVNEIHYDNTGSDVGEAIEIAGPAGTDLSGWSIVRYNGNGGASYGATTLSGTLTDAGSGFGFQVTTYPPNGLQNGSPDGIALVDGGGDVVQFLSYEGSFVAANGPATGMTSTDIGVSEASGTPVGFSLQLTGSGSGYEDFAWTTAAANTFGDINTGQSFGAAPPPPPPPGPCDAGDVFIHQVQGSGDASECVGDTVTIEAVVVGDFEGPSPTLRGFYLQEEDADQDADPLTSEGIFVFHGSEDTVNIGDLVRVTGDVAEFQGQTQIGFPDSVVVVGSDFGSSVTPNNDHAAVCQRHGTGSSRRYVSGGVADAVRHRFIPAGSLRASRSFVRRSA